MMFDKQSTENQSQGNPPQENQSFPTAYPDDRNPEPTDTATTMEMLKAHLPIALLVLGVLGVFFGLHLGVAVLIGAAAGHVLLGLLIMGAARLRQKQRAQV